MKSYPLVGLGLFTASFIVGRLDMKAADLKMDRMRIETRADMDRMRNETRADMEAADLKMDRMRNETRADMGRMRIETLVYNGFTLFVAILVIIIPFLTKSK